MNEEIAKMKKAASTWDENEKNGGKLEKTEENQENKEEGSSKNFSN